jgi:hypothetical protein
MPVDKQGTMPFRAVTSTVTYVAGWRAGKEGEQARSVLPFPSEEKLCWVVQAFWWGEGNKLNKIEVEVGKGQWKKIVLKPLVRIKFTYYCIV